MPWVEKRIMKNEGDPISRADLDSTYIELLMKQWDMTYEQAFEFILDAGLLPGETLEDRRLQMQEASILYFQKKNSGLN